MVRSLYLECESGISGDMAVAALLDLGADEHALRRALASLGLEGFEIKVGRVDKNGISACDFDVVLDGGYENHDHDMAFLFGHLDEGRAPDGPGAHDRAADGARVDGSGSPGEPSHGHGEHGHGSETHGHGHDHAHRKLADVLDIIGRADLSSNARSIARRIFEVLADAEGAAHGKSRDEVHFHEVGSIDSIVDVVSCAVCFDDLGVDRVVVERLTEGHGTVRCAHGVLPVPVPAVTQIVGRFGIPLHRCGVAGELVTPTGAAIAAALRTDGRLPETFAIVKTGIGAGKRPYPGCPGILRAHLIDSFQPDGDAVWRLETDIDDCDGETLGRCVGKVLSSGALEAHFIPTVTKKNRPAWQLQALCTEGARPDVERTIFEETTTIGIRRCRMERTVLERESVAIMTDLGSILAKRVTLPSGSTRTYPEHDSVAALAEKVGEPYPDVLRACIRACSSTDGRQ